MTPTTSPNHVISPAEAGTHATDRPAVRLRSLAELGQIVHLLGDDPEAVDAVALNDLVQALTEAEAELAAAATSDAAARQAATDALARYDRAREGLRRANEVVARAASLVTRAGELRASAFTPEARESAQAAIERGQRALDEATRERDRARAEEAALAVRPEVRRLLVERQAREYARRRDAERAARRSQLADAVRNARALADDRDFAAALSFLDPWVREFPEEEPLVMLVERWRCQALAVRNNRAFATLWEIRRALRSRPAEVLVAVEAIDFAGLDEGLARQLFGEWLRAIRQLDLPGAMRHTPRPHRGALLVPDDGPDRLRVVSAVGGGPLAKGQVVARAALTGLRPAAEGPG